MSLRLALASALVALALVAVAVGLFGLSFERAAVLAPVFVLSLGAVAGLLLLWARVALDSLRRRDPP